MTSLNKELLTRLGAKVVTGFYFTEDEIIEGCKDVDAVIGSAAVQPWTRRVIESLPRLRIIASIGIGYDHLDIKSATDNGVLTTNVPDYCIDEVSDTAMALILSLYRKLPTAASAAKEGKWVAMPEHRPIMNPIYRIQGQTLGLVGLGRLGSALARKAKAFNMKVIAHDPYVSADAAKNLGVELVELNVLLETSDYVSLHAPYTPENQGMIGKDQFKKMKKTAYLINTARGQLVDESALIAALQGGEISGAGLDVLAQEPPDIDNPLLNMNNVIVTGHSAQISEEANAELFERPQQECARVLQGKWPISLLNPEAKEKFVARFGPMK